MQILGPYCLFVSIYSVLELYQRVLRILVGFWVMDVASTLKFLTKAGEIGCGFFLRGSFSRVFNVVGMVLIFVLCMKILHFGWHLKGLMRSLCEFGGKPRYGFCLKNGVIKVCASMITHFKCGSLKSSQDPNLLNKNNSTSGKGNVNSKGDTDTNLGVREETGDGERDVHDDDKEYVHDDDKEYLHDDDKEYDVMTLRNLVKIERQRANAAYAELEEERRASASAAEEAMAMILRLQSEKSSVEIEANQFRRMAEQKEKYDQEVIESLEWIIMQNEYRISLLGDQLMLYREKLRQYEREDEMEQFEGLDNDDANRTLSNFSMDEDLVDSVISTPEMDSQTL